MTGNEKPPRSTSRLAPPKASSSSSLKQPKGTTTKSSPLPTVDESGTQSPSRSTMRVADDAANTSTKRPPGFMPRSTSFRRTTQHSHGRSTIQPQATKIRHDPGPPPFVPAPPTPANLVKYCDKQRAFVPVSTEPLFGTNSAPLEQTIPTTHPRLKPPDGTPKLRNAFNSTDTALQTNHRPLRDREVGTDDQPLVHAFGQCTPKEIYDSYMNSNAPPIDNQSALASSSSEGASTSSSGAVVVQQQQGRQSVAHAAKVLQRLAFQNINNDIAMDFKYWEDPADAARPNEGTLLPLWTFCSPPSSFNRAVTALSWNTRYWDMFAAGYGCFEPDTLVPGLVCCHSIKNPEQPEWQLETPSGILCLDFHPTASHLLAIGCQDGTILVANLALNQDSSLNINSKAVKASDSSTKRHIGGVWEVQWLPSSSPQELKFFSAGADGKVMLWEVKNGSLYGKDVFEFASIAEGGDLLGGLPAGCSCIDTIPSRPSELLVGTQEGRIYRCSTDYGAARADTYHDSSSGCQPLYTVRWNPHMPSAFFAVSSAGSVGIWNTNHHPSANINKTTSSKEKRGPVIKLDADSAVGDAAWAPYSSTVVAAVTDSGRVLVYDLEKSRDAPLCSQKVVKKAQLTKIRFNAKHPIIIVGHNRGEVLCFKLSPNLRITSYTTSSNAPSTTTTGQQQAAVNRPANSTRRKGTKKEANAAPNQSERLQAVLQQAYDQLPSSSSSH